MTGFRSSLLRERSLAALHVLGGILANATGRTTLPRVAHFCPTWRCNQGCAGCSVSQRLSADEMTTQQVLRMFSQLRFLDIIKLVGGEPFIREDLPDIAAFIADEIRPYILQVVTNGSMTDRVLALARRVGSPRLNIRVSLSGIGGTHERLTGGASYDAVHETLMRLIEIRSELRFSLGINYRLSDDTLDDLPLAEECYGARGVDIIPGLHYQPFLTDVDIRKTTFELEHLRQRERIMAVMASRTKRRGHMSRLESLILARSTEHAAHTRLAGGGINAPFGCRELRNLMYLLPNGDLVYCGLRHTKVGNLAGEDFDTIWYGEEINGHRREIDSCPGCPQAAIEIFSRLYRGRF